MLRPALALLAAAALAASVNAAPERRVTSNESRTPRQAAPPAREPAKESPRDKADKTEGPARQYSLSAKMTLGDGKVVRGQVKLSAPESMQISHETGGVRYERQLHPDEISSVEVLRWKHRFLKENSSGLVYEFAPDEVRIRLKDGGEIKRSGPIFSFLKQFAVENKNGKVTLFTFWIDLKKPDGKWYTGLSGPENGVRVTCHPEVVRRIDFD